MKLNPIPYNIVRALAGAVLVALGIFIKVNDTYGSIFSWIGLIAFCAIGGVYFVISVLNLFVYFANPKSLDEIKAKDAAEKKKQGQSGISSPVSNNYSKKKQASAPKETSAFDINKRMKKLK